MRRIQLEEKELTVLRTLEERGAMSPSQVSASTWMMPGETLSLLKTLSSEGFVLMRNDTHSPDGLVVAITQDARSYLNVNLPTLKKE
jgi:DNA-binding IclR family transcriptional regulator